MITDFRLRVFRTAAEKLSFTRAASELFITQPAVTKHVGELERQLGVALFLRRGGTISLTPEGERLLGYARRILSLYGELNLSLIHISLFGRVMTHLSLSRSKDRSFLPRGICPA